LKRYFTDGRFIRLFDDASWDAGLRLCILPRPERYKDRIEGWVRFDQAHRAVNHAALSHVTESSLSDVLEPLSRLHPMIGKDDFLETCFWLKFALAGMHDRTGYLARSGLLRRIQPSRRIHDFAKPHIGRMYYFAGETHYHEGRFQESLECFNEAASWDPRFQMPRKFRVRLLQRIKNGPSPGSRPVRDAENAPPRHGDPPDQGPTAP
jgi:hypothetical protein